MPHSHSIKLALLQLSRRARRAMAILILFFGITYVLLYTLAESPPLGETATANGVFIPGGNAQGALAGQKPLQDEGNSALEEWLEKEEVVALDRLLANIAPGGRNAQDAIAGSVIASPSREHPDYYYQWVRDAGITTNTLARIYSASLAPSSSSASTSPSTAKLASLADAANLETILNAYTSLSSKIQHTDNPSGTFANLSGLGEPKFGTDGSAYTEDWGRPQRDGPALRAITLINYLKAYNASHPDIWMNRSRKEEGDGDGDGEEDFFDKLYKAELPAHSVIKADLEFVSQTWNLSGFDVWEEVDGLHFFTAMAQLKSLREGSALAAAFGDLGAAGWYSEQAKHMERFVKRFWSEEKEYLVETLDTDRSGLDCAVLLGSLHGYPEDGGEEGERDEPVYPPYSDEVLVSLLAFVGDQGKRFPVNKMHSSGGAGLEGVGLGRYPEDVYDGYNTSSIGHPWFLCTASAAEILYRTAKHISGSGTLRISARGLPFYKALLSSSEMVVEADTTYDANSALFHSTIERLVETGDQFLEVVKTHAGAEGSMSEQFDRVTGFQRGARDLTWSYGAFLEAMRARKGVK